MEDLVTIVGSLGIVAAAGAYGALVSGFVLTRLWHWFIVSQLHVADLSIRNAVGLGLIVGLFTFASKTSTETHSKPTGTAISVALMTPWFLLLVGYIVHVI